MADLGDELRELEELRAFLRSVHPEFVRVDEILSQLLVDPSISPQAYDLICEAVFIVLGVYAEAMAK